MPHRAIITGISGFAGGFLAEHLLEAGDAVLGCSPDGMWAGSSPDSLPSRVELLAWDLGQPEGPVDEIRRRIEQFQPDVIYHLAAISTPRDCGEERPTAAAFNLNVGGTLRIVDLAASLPRRPRMLLTSSSHVYGQARPQSCRMAENAPLRPRSGYGQTKLAAEEAIRLAVAEGRCDGVIARAFQHSGPRQDAPMMLSEWARQFARASAAAVTVQTCDAQVDLSDVRDVVRAYRLLAERGLSGEAYNVGSGISRRTGDILELMRRMADPGRAVMELSPGWKQDPIADVTRLVRATGWTAAIPLEQTVADTLAWWRNRERGN